MSQKHSLIKYGYLDPQLLTSDSLATPTPRQVLFALTAGHPYDLLGTVWRDQATNPMLLYQKTQGNIA